MKFSYFGAASVLAFALSAAGPADAAEELRVAVVHHNMRTDHGEWADPKEDGPNVEVELVYKSPDLLELLGSPRPYTMVSANTQGNTSFAAAGLYWRWEFADGWALEPGFGYAIHDGERDIPLAFPDNSPEATAFEASHQLLGSRDLFRTSIGLERELGRSFAIQLYYEHLSHGQILDKGRNQGLDEAGLRFIYRFDPDSSH